VLAKWRQEVIVQEHRLGLDIQLFPSAANNGGHNSRFALSLLADCQSHRSSDSTLTMLVDSAYKALGSSKSAEGALAHEGLGGGEWDPRPSDG
jgi:hypothetical protein